MRKIFQDNWHGITFQDFAKLSSRNLAGAEFYEKFYKFFFTKYHGWDDLDPLWLGLKLKAVNFLEERLAGQKNTKILSVSCGLGVMEKVLFERGYRCLDITESSAQPLIWIKECISCDRIFIGAFPDCLPEGRSYDLIYLSGVEYFLDQKGLMELLKSVRARLAKTGKCILISYSYEPSGWLNRVMLSVKNFAKYLLDVLKIRPRGQFWGYSRSREDLRAALNEANFMNIEEGIINAQRRYSFCWVEGKT